MPLVGLSWDKDTKIIPDHQTNKAKSYIWLQGYRLADLFPCNTKTACQFAPMLPMGEKCFRVCTKFLNFMCLAVDFTEKTPF